MGSCDSREVAGAKNNNNKNNDNNKEEDKIKIYDGKKNDKQKHIDKPISNDQELITVIFSDMNGSIKHPLICNKSEIFSSVEKKLYEACPDAKGIKKGSNDALMTQVLNNLEELFPNLMINNDYDPNSLIGNNYIYFHVKGIQIDKSKTLKDNNIKDNTIIIFSYSDFNQINVKFISDFFKIDYEIPCYDIYLFSTIEQKLYNEYPELKEINIIFKVLGNRIYKSLTLEENNIKNNSIISMEIVDGIKIKVTFISIDQKTKCSISCFDSEIFTDIEKELYKKAPQLKKEYYFLCNGTVIDKSLTFAQNKIKNNNIILINEVNSDEDELNKLIAIIFISTDDLINCAVSGNIKDKFYILVDKLIQQYPELKGKEMYFLCNGMRLTLLSTLEENELKNGSMVVTVRVEDYL